MLLKKWKQAWKKEEGFGHKGSRHHDRSHHNHNVRRKSELSSTSEYYNNERPYPRFSTKATRTFDDVDNDDPSEDASRPTKRQKVEDADCSGVYVFLHKSGKMGIGSAISCRDRLQDHLNSFYGHRPTTFLHK